MHSSILTWYENENGVHKDNGYTNKQNGIKNKAREQKQALPQDVLKYKSTPE